jgi:medium-chain acyl-[acyl-carrier-protein] hydrolase
MSNSSPQSLWFGKQRPNPGARLRLFCFPYAGGSAAIYRQWPQQLPPTIEVLPAHLPGRQGRLRESPPTRIDPLVEGIADAIRPLLDIPYAFFGHSMGATVAYELARTLRGAGAGEPAHLFVSGRRPPHVQSTEAPTYNLPDAELIEEVRRLEGTPPEVLDHPELMQLLLPLLRADFEVIETYSYTPGPPLTCPVTAFGGLRDAELGREQLEGWREHTTGRFAVKMFEGGHFFIHEAARPLLDTIARELSGAAAGGA